MDSLTQIITLIVVIALAVGALAVGLVRGRGRSRRPADPTQSVPQPGTDYVPRVGDDATGEPIVRPRPVAEPLQHLLAGVRRRVAPVGESVGPGILQQCVFLGLADRPARTF